MVDVGRTQIIVDADTGPYIRKLERLKAAARKAGVQAGEAYSDGAASGLRSESGEIEKEVDRTGTTIVKRMERTGTRSGDRFGKSFWKRARETFSKPWQALDDEVRLVIAAIAASFSELAALGSGLAASFTAILATVGPSAGALASFSSLLPGLAFGLSLASAGLRDIEKFAPEASASLDNLKRVFQEVDVPAFMDAWNDSLSTFLDTLANSLEFDQIAEALGGALSIVTQSFTDVLNSPSFTAFVDAMESTLPFALAAIGDGAASLTEAFLGFSAAAAPVVAQMAAAFSDATAELAAWVEEGLRTGEITAMVEAWAESLDITLDLIGNLTTALSTLFISGQETGNSILTTISDLLFVWNEWMQSIEGQQALQEWFAQGEEIFNALLPLIGAVGSSIADLVTPEVVAQLLVFIESLTNFMPILTEVLGLFSDLNVLGIIAELLNAVSEALTPVMPQLSELATTLGEALIAAIIAVTPVLVVLVDAVAQILPTITKVLPSISELIEVLAEGLTPIIEALTPIIEILAEIVGDYLANNIDSIIPIVEIFADVLLIVAEYVSTLLMPVLRGLRSLVKKMGENIQTVNENALRPLARWFQNLADNAQNWREKTSQLRAGLQRLGEKISGQVIEKLRTAKGWVDDVSSAFTSFRDIVGGAIDSVVSALGRISWPTPPSWLTNGIAGVTPSFFASGGVVAGPTNAVIGEAGPEAVIPLARPLSQVDPAVRDIAAFAQGKSAFARGGVAGGGVSIAPGAIQVVSPYANPRLVADEVLDEMVLAGK